MPPLLVVPRQPPHQAKAQHHPAFPKQLDQHPHLLRHRRNQAKAAAKTALHANAPTVDKSATSKPTESQYPSPFLNVPANVKSRTSDKRVWAKPRARSQPRPKVRPSRLLLQEVWACDRDPTSLYAAKLLTSHATCASITATHPMRAHDSS